MRTWEHIKLEELPRHNALGFFCSWWVGREGSLKIHMEIKKGGCLHSITMHKFFCFPQQSSTAIGPTG
jgi:hypothetical protein